MLKAGSKQIKEYMDKKLSKDTLLQDEYSRTIGLWKIEWVFLLTK
jgi:hypothetical protein